MCVGACKCVWVCALTCIKSLQRGWLCSQTAQSGCIATKSPHSPPSPSSPSSSLLCKRLNNRVTWKHFEHSHTLTSECTALSKKHHSMCVCVCYVCWLSVDSTERNTWKRKKSSSQLCSITDRETQNSNRACSSASRCGWILMFSVWTSLRALSLLCSYTVTCFFSALAFFLFLHSLFFLPPFHTSASAYLAKWEFCVSWKSRYPLRPPSPSHPLFPLHLPCGLVRERCTTSSFAPAAKVVHWVIHWTNRCC